MGWLQALGRQEGQLKDSIAGAMGLAFEEGGLGSWCGGIAIDQSCSTEVAYMD